MPISVVCRGCHKRFSVSDKFAGKKGPCPQCKTVIEIPKAEDEVAIHAPETSGPKSQSGQPVLKPITREETKISTLTIIITVIATIGVLAVAWMFRIGEGEEGSAPTIILMLGAIALAFPLSWGGYAFLRNEELEPYRGKSLWLRLLICSAVYSVLWGIYAYIFKGYVFGGESLELPQLAIAIPPIIVFGALTAFATLDLEFTLAIVHYGFYLAVTVLLRLIMGLPAI